MNPAPALFEQHEIRRVYDEATETWRFSIVDILQVLIQQPDYWADHEAREKLEGLTGQPVVTAENALPSKTRKAFKAVAETEDGGSS